MFCLDDLLLVYLLHSSMGLEALNKKTGFLPCPPSEV